MPNWSFTQYAIKGKKEEIDELEMIMKKTKSLKKPMIENDFGSNWIGCLYMSLGFDPAEYTDCRGSYSDVRVEGGVLFFMTTTAWSKSEVLDALLVNKYPSMEVIFYEEECSNGIYHTNDMKKEFFPEEYIVYMEDVGDEFCDNAEEVYSKISEYLGREMDSEKFLEYLNLDEDDERYGGEIRITKIKRMEY